MKNSKYNNSKKNSMSLMMGYCSVLIAVACILMIGFFVVSHISSEEIERSSARLVLQVRELCDEAASEAETLAFRIFNIPSVSKLASTKYNDRKNVGDHVKNIHSELVTALEISKITDEMYVVIKDADICVNSSAKFNLKIFYEVYFSAYFSSYDECMDTLFHFDGDYKKYITLKNANGELTTVFVCRPLGSGIEDDVYSVLTFKPEFSLHTFIGSNEGSVFFLYDGESQLDVNGVKVELPNFSEEENGEIEINGNVYVYNTAASERLPGRYMYLLDKSSYFRVTKTINSITLFSCFFAILSGLFVSFANGRKHNEFMKKLLSTINVTERQMNHANKKLKENVLSNMISGNINHAGKTALEEGLLSGGRFAVLIIFEVLDFGVYEKNEYELVYFAISNILSEVIADVYEASIDYCVMNEYFVGVLSFDDDSLSTDAIKERVDYANGFANNNLGVNLNYILSRVFDDFDAISEVYKKTESAFTQVKREILQMDDEGMRSQEIKQYVSDNYQNPDLSVQMTADHFGLSLGYVSRHFKAKNGFGLARYIMEVRVEKAKELLESSNFTCAQIAEKVGFLSNHVFIKNFSKIEGCTPGVYRKQYKSGK